MSDTFDPGPHCGREGCLCMHDCEKGWLWEERTDHRGRTYEAVVSCPQCDPERHRLQRAAKSRARLQEALRGRSRHARVDRAKQRDRDETQVI